MIKMHVLHFGNKLSKEFSGFGHQSEKFSRIGACIGRNFMPWKFMMLILFIVVFYVLLFIKITLEVKPCSNGNDSWW